MIKAVDLNLSHPHIHRQFPMGNLIGCCLQRHRWWSLARDDKEGQVSEFGSCWSAARVQWPHGSSMLILKFIFNKRIQGRYVKEPKYLSYICTYYRNQVSCRWKSSQWCIPAMSSGFMWKVCNLHKPWEPLASYMLFTSLLDNFLLVGTINPVLTVTQLLLHSHVRTWKASKRITGACVAVWIKIKASMFLWIVWLSNLFSVLAPLRPLLRGVSVQGLGLATTLATWTHCPAASISVVLIALFIDWLIDLLIHWFIDYSSCFFHVFLALLTVQSWKGSHCLLSLRRLMVQV